MATIIFTGNLGQDPDVKYTQSGELLCHLSVGHTPRKFNQQAQNWEDDGQTQWYSISLFGGAGEAAADQLRKGDQVRVEGQLVHRAFQRQDGTDGLAYDVRRATVTKTLKPATPADGSQTAVRGDQNAPVGQGGYPNQAQGRQGGVQAPNTGRYGATTTRQGQGRGGQTFDTPPF